MDINIEVFTNINKDRKIIWPRKLCCRPQIGDTIQSFDGKHVRKICGITHCFCQYLVNTEANYCYLKIEVD